MTFTGFPTETPQFLRDLRANNDKGWFEEHREDYDRFFLDPARQLVEAIAPRVGRLDPPHEADPRINKSIRKIHRDVRFSKDKTPYDPRLHLIFWAGSHPLRSSGLHLVFEADGFGFGAGHWAFDPKALTRYREQIVDAEIRRELEEALATAATVGCELGEPELVRPARGYSADPTHSSWLRRKGLVARTMQATPYDPRLFTEEAVPFLAQVMEALVPVSGWIGRYVEPRDP